MSVPDSTIQRVRTFVKKYNHNQLDWKKDLNSDEQQILKDLINAVDLFEMAEEERRPSNPLFSGISLGREMPRSYKYNLNTTTSNLNKFIKIAEINEMYVDLTKEDSKEVKNLKKLNDILANQKNQLQNILDQIFSEYTAIRQKYQSKINSIKTEETKVE